MVKKTKSSKENLVKEVDEQLQAMVEMLQAQKQEQLKALTNPSAIALNSTVKSTGDNIKNVKKTPTQLFNLYLTNQFVARGVNIRADTLVSKNYAIIGEDKNGVKACQDLVSNSGDLNLFRQLAINAYISGDAYLEPIWNQNETKMIKLKHVHPLTISFKKDLETGRIIINTQTKEPIKYIQSYIDKDGNEQEKLIGIDKIKHFLFDSIGDEFTGVSILQSGYNTIVRLMNMEYSAAEAAVKTANPLWVAECNTKSPHQVAQWATILGNINGKDQLFIPEGMKLGLMSPGHQNFSEYADYFLDAAVATVGVPKAVLLGGSGSSGGSNRAEQSILTRHFYSMMRGNQLSMADFFNKIFREYGEKAGFKAPRLVFGDVAEDADVMTASAVNLYKEGIITIEEARAMIGLDEQSKGMFKQDVSAAQALKQSDMKTYFPASPGSPAGSQKGVKASQRANTFSDVKTATSKKQ